MNLPFPEPMPKLLLPLSALYGTGMAVRNWAYDLGLIPTTASSIPIVSVGNLTVGGSGKTPFVRALALQLIEQGRRPAILSRGYGGSEPGPLLVTSAESVARVGDEALMQVLALGPKVPIVVARDRVAGVRLIESQGLADLILLDDGFQHRKLARQVDLLLVDRSEQTLDQILWSNQLLPSGTLRERAKPALKRVSAMVFVCRSLTADWKLEREQLPLELPQLRFQLIPAALRQLTTGVSSPLADLRGKRVIAFTAIAKPKTFSSLLRELGAEIVEECFFTDHHQFEVDELLSVMRRHPGITVLTTEKDAVKLLPLLRPVGSELAQLIMSLELSGRFAPGDAAALLKLLRIPSKFDVRKPV